MLIVKYSDFLKCPECKTDIMFDGEATYREPLGFGSHPNKSGFFVDQVQYKGWFSDCMKCKKRILAYKSKKIVSKKISLPFKHGL